MQKKSKTEIKVIRWILLIIAAMQFGAIVYFNYVKAYGILETDSALAFRHAAEMWKNGLFLRNWVYSTTLENDSAGFFAALLYLKTGNLNIAMSLCHAIEYGIVAAIIYDICRNVKASREQFLLAVIMVFSPYSAGPLDWAPMLWFSYGFYSFRVILMLVMLDLMLRCESGNAKGIKWVILMMFSLFLSVMVSLSTGNYIICMLFLPVILGYILICVRRAQFSWRNKENLVLLLNSLAAGAGYLIRLHYIGASVRNDLSLITAAKFPENVQRVFVGALQLFGALTRISGLSIFSFTGIGVLIRVVLLGLCVILVVKKICASDFKGGWPVYFTMIFGVNFGILLMMDASYGSDVFENRYHLLWGVLLVLVAAFTLKGGIEPEEKEEKSDSLWDKAILCGVVIALLAVNVTGFRQIDKVDLIDEDKGFERVILQTAKDWDAEAIFIYNEVTWAAVVRVLDMDIYCSSVTYNGRMQMMPYIFYDSYMDNSKVTGNNIFLCWGSVFEQLPDHIKSAYTLVDSETFGGGLNVYFAERCVWDHVTGVPLPGETHTIDLPYSPNYAYTGVIDPSGSLIADETTEGYVLSSPSTVAMPGRYNVTLYYHLKGDGEQPTIFNISADYGNTALVSSVLSPEEEAFTFYQLDITGEARLQFRVWKELGTELIIDRLEFVKVDTTE